MSSGTPITYGGGKLKVPSDPIIPFIRGDGIGPDVVDAGLLVLDAAVEKTFKGKRKIAWREAVAGEEAFKRTNEWLPEATLDEIRQYRVALKGPLTTPVGGGIRSLNVAIRQKLDLYACIRPVKYYSGVPSPHKLARQVDIVIFRENMEDLYAGIEWGAASPEAARVREALQREVGVTLRPDAGIGIKLISKYGTQRLVRAAIRYALAHKRRRVTLVHKGNIMKFTEGAFRQWGYEAAKEFPEVITEEEALQRHDGKAPPDKLVVGDRIADNMFAQIVQRPGDYDVIATPNLNGDYLSDLAASLVGGLGIAPGANVGDGIGVFEATHGTAPKYAGQDKVNPGSLILSGALMLEFLGWDRAAKKIQAALAKTIRAKIVTYDLARQMGDVQPVGTRAFAQAIVERL